MYSSQCYVSVVVDQGAGGDELHGSVYNVYSVVQKHWSLTYLKIKIYSKYTISCDAQKTFDVFDLMTNILSKKKID